MLNCKGVQPVACTDIDFEAARESVGSLEGDVPVELANRIYTTIMEAREKHRAEVCLIYVTTTAHAKLIVESLNLDMHTLCVKPVVATQDEVREIVRVHKSHPNLMLV